MAVIGTELVFNRIWQCDSTNTGLMESPVQIWLESGRRIGGGQGIGNYKFDGIYRVKQTIARRIA